MANNLLLISVDDLNAWATVKSLYPGTIYTPNLDALIAQGTNFTDAYATVAICGPSRTSVLTSQDPFTTGVLQNNVDMTDRVDASETLTAILKSSGYYVDSVGKVYHNTPTDEATVNVMFDHNQGVSGSNPTSTTGNSEVYTGDEENLVDVKTAEYAAQFLLNYESSTPFALSVGFFKPHTDFVVPQEYFDLYPLDELVLPVAPTDDRDDLPDDAIEAGSDMLEAKQSDEWAKYVQGYLAALTYIDEQIGKVLSALEASGQADNTTIVLFSDHGQHLGEKDRSAKFTCWEEALRSPLIIVDPDYTAGQTVDHTVSLLDVAPTILDLLGIDIPDQMEGTSLVPLMENTETEWEGVAFSSRYANVISVRTEQYRYILNVNGGEELYDIDNDPHEITNLANNSAYAEIKAELAQLVQDYLTEHHVFRPDSTQTILLGTDTNDTLTNLERTNVSLQGGNGDDVYLLIDYSAPVVEQAGGGSDTVETTLRNYTLTENVENLYSLTTTGKVTMSGNAEANLIVGSATCTLEGFAGDDTLRAGDGNALLLGDAGNDSLQGSRGADTLYGASGNDHLAGDSSNDVAYGESGSDTLYGGVGHDSLNGGAGNDLQYGESGNDTLNDGTGNDTLIGGAGSDVYYISSASTVIIENAGEGIDEVYSPVSYTLGDDVENLTLTGETALIGTGNARNNVIVGNSANNSLTGGDGADTLSGGAGADSLHGDTGNDILLGESGDDTLWAGVGYDSLSGGSGNDLLYGEAGNDTLDAGTGVDTLSGGANNDVYYINSTAAVIIENAGQGTDQVYSTATYALADNVENLTLTGTAAINGTGNDHANVIIGNEAGNVLTGAGGDDSLNGWQGADTLFGGDGNDQIDGGSENDWASGDSGDDSLNGYAGNDTLLGGGGNDTLVGNADADDLDGGAGNDSLDGGAGNDSLNAGEGDDSLLGGNGDDSLNGWENADTLYGGIGNDTLHGGSGNDWASGDEGNDSLNGYAGNDSLYGGVGNDILDGNSDSDSLEGGDGDDSLDGGAGKDDLNGGYGNDSLLGGTGDDSLNGWQDADTLFGGSGNDTLHCGSENDWASGDDGNDSLNGYAGNDTLLGGAGNDIVDGNSYNDSLDGGTGDDSLNGNSGGDTLIGGSGADMLTGGTGADKFVFLATTDSGVAGTHDTIVDFEGVGAAAGDVIDLSAIDAKTTAAGEQAFVFIGTGAFTGVAGQLHVIASGTDSLVQGDVNGDGVADFQILVKNAAAAAWVAGDFLL